MIEDIEFQVLNAILYGKTTFHITYQRWKDMDKAGLVVFSEENYISGKNRKITFKGLFEHFLYVKNYAQ